MGIADGLIALYQPEKSPGLVKALQHLCAGMVNSQSMQHGFRFIILTDGNLTAAYITDALCLSGVIYDVIAGATLGADASAGHALSDCSIVNL